MQTRSARCLVVTAALIAAGGARAQDIASGKHIAQVWCSNCHLVDSENPKVVSDAVPTFSSIAQTSSTTAVLLAVFLSTPHGRMPDFVLSRRNIRDVSAYILSLRKSP